MTPGVHCLVDHGQRDKDISLLACVVSKVPGPRAAQLAFYVAVGSDGHILPPVQVIRPCSSCVAMVQVYSLPSILQINWDCSSNFFFIQVNIVHKR
jgi:hypothetical protein